MQLNSGLADETLPFPCPSVIFDDHHGALVENPAGFEENSCGVNFETIFESSFSPLLFSLSKHLGSNSIPQNSFETF